jgi:rhamnosyltransferase
MARLVTVAIPVLNGSEYLDEVLAAVRAQEVKADVELLVVDSGSTDGSLEIAERRGARVHEIPKSEFSHGGTRNLMMELAKGERVAGSPRSWGASSMPKTWPRSSGRTSPARTQAT